MNIEGNERCPSDFEVEQYYTYDDCVKDWSNLTQRPGE
jgi:hypothetical protein